MPPQGNCTKLISCGAVSKSVHMAQKRMDESGAMSSKKQLDIEDKLKYAQNYSNIF
jgi:hypothetical protein